MDNVIEARGLVKKFGGFAALDGLDLTVAAGEVAGFLGPNGAGKSTAIRVLLGMYRANGGTARVFGADPFAEAVAIHSRLAYVPGDVSLWPQLTGGECIDVLLRLRGVDPGASRRGELIDRFELDPTKRSGTYSKGNRQKVALIAALAVDTELLIFDEPTSGLDPLMAQQFRVCAREAAQRGASVLLSSHVLSEVEELCESVTIIRAGVAVQAGTLEQLRHLRRSRVRMTVVGGGAEQLRAIEGVHDFDTVDTVDSVGSGATGVDVSCTVEPQSLGALTRAMGSLSVTRLLVEPPSLEELFLHAYDADPTGQPAS